jgi:hypothetical protein
MLMAWGAGPGTEPRPLFFLNFIGLRGNAAQGRPGRCPADADPYLLRQRLIGRRLILSTFRIAHHWTA